MFNRNQIQIILPCAGFGRRVGSPNSKEMLPHPFNRNKRIIDFSLETAQKFQIPVLAVLRKEKTELISYLKQIDLVKIVEIEPTQDWQESILSVQQYFSKKNILMLPDTEFSSQDVVLKILESLDTKNLAYGTLQTNKELNSNEISSWGWIKKHPREQASKLFIWEKPKITDVSLTENYLAWGLIGFSGAVGTHVLKTHFASQMINRPLELPYSIETFPLLDFLDLTRSASVLKNYTTRPENLDRSQN